MIDKKTQNRWIVEENLKEVFEDALIEGVGFFEAPDKADKWGVYAVEPNYQELEQYLLSRFDTRIASIYMYLYTQENLPSFSPLKYLNDRPDKDKGYPDVNYFSDRAMKIKRGHLVEYGSLHKACA